MTIVAEAPETAAHRIMASLYKLETTLEVDEVGRQSAVVRELALIKVAAGPDNRAMLFSLAEVFHARIVDLAPESLMLELTAGTGKIEGMLQVVKESGYELLEVSRTGRMAMRRGRHTSRVLQALEDVSGKHLPPTQIRGLKSSAKTAVAR
jgi:acetolactate synthase-1/3 small subunit